MFCQPAANAPFRLSDSAKLNLAVSAEADRTHRPHPGPLVPDEAVSPAAKDGPDAILQAASARLRKQALAVKL